MAPGVTRRFVAALCFAWATFMTFNVPTRTTGRARHAPGSLSTLASASGGDGDGVSAAVRAEARAAVELSRARAFGRRRADAGHEWRGFRGERGRPAQSRRLSVGEKARTGAAAGFTRDSDPSRSAAPKARLVGHDAYRRHARGAEPRVGHPRSTERDETGGALHREERRDAGRRPWRHDGRWTRARLFRFPGRRFGCR